MSGGEGTEGQEAAKDDRKRWDVRYLEGDWHDRDAPSFIVEKAESWLPDRGLAVDLACGAGRNALFLAARGLRVLGVDISIEALRILRRRSNEQRGRVVPVLAELPRFAVRRESIDVVVNSYFLLPDLFAWIRDALRPGGIVLFETYHADELDVLGGDIRRAYALKKGQLRASFRDYEHLFVGEGVFETEDGERGLGRIIARKPSVTGSAIPGSSTSGA